MLEILDWSNNAGFLRRWQQSALMGTLRSLTMLHQQSWGRTSLYLNWIWDYVEEKHWRKTVTVLNNPPTHSGMNCGRWDITFSHQLILPKSKTVRWSHNFMPTAIRLHIGECDRSQSQLCPLTSFQLPLSLSCHTHCSPLQLQHSDSDALVHVCYLLDKMSSLGKIPPPFYSQD